MPLKNGEDVNSSNHFESERLLHRIQRLEEENKALAYHLTRSRHESKTAIADRERADAKYAELLQHESKSEAQIASLQTQHEQDSREITQLVMKVDKRRDENNKLREENESLTTSLDETRSSLCEETKTVTQLKENLVNLSADLQVYEYFTRIGISLRHRSLELEHVPSEQDQSLIEEGNKASRSSACLADAQLYLTREHDDVPLTQQSHLSILLGEPRHDASIYKKLYGSSPVSVANFANVEEFVQMVDYRGAMFKFLGEVRYAQSNFAALIKEMNELIRGKGEEGTRSAFRSKKGRQILIKMDRLYNEAARQYS